MKLSRTLILISVASFSPSPAVPWVKMWVMMVTSTNEMRVKKMPFFEANMGGSAFFREPLLFAVNFCPFILIREGMFWLRIIPEQMPSTHPCFLVILRTYLCQTLNVISYGPQRLN